MTEPDITEDPEAWLAGQSTTPEPGRRPDTILRDMYPHGRRPDKPDWQTSHPHGALNFTDEDDPFPGALLGQFRVSHHAPPPAGAVDLIVKTNGPNYLQQTLNQLPRVHVQVLTADWNEQTQEALLRCYNGCEGFVRYACEHQGYAEIVGIIR